MATPPITLAEVDTIIANIKIMLANPNGASQYSLDTGQSRVSITRQSPMQMIETLNYWLQFRMDLIGCLNGTGGIVSIKDDFLFKEPKRRHDDI
jgi:hypothetical protein